MTAKNYNTIIDNARMYAIDAHKGQKDDTGNDYYLAHIKPVADILALVTTDQEIIAAGYLHDTLEDTGTTLYDLAAKFTPRIARLVYEVTKEGDKSTGYYFPRLQSRDAILIKFADRLSNLSRMQPWPEKRQKQYLAKSRFWKLDNYKI